MQSFQACIFFKHSPMNIEAFFVKIWLWGNFLDFLKFTTDSQALAWKSQRRC